MSDDFYEDDRGPNFAGHPLARKHFPASAPSQAMQDVMAERRRQIEAEGWSVEHDDEHDDGQLGRAATAYVWHASVVFLEGEAYTRAKPPGYWPWSREWWKPKDRRRDLVKAAALIVAEIERLDRAAQKQAA